MKEKAIDIAQIDLAGLPQKEFPAARKFRIFMNRQAHEAVWEHARQSVKEGRKEKGEIVEVGGILIGDIYKDEEGPFLEIVAVIVAEHTKNEGTQMTFTPETWEQVNRVKSAKYPDSRVVGWYHTHPRFGIFLSDMDKFIHQHHFPQPWTTALVVDPVQESEGFFVWGGGEPCAAGEYWVGSERRESSRKGRREPAEPSEPRPAAQPQQESPLVQSISALSLALCFVGVLFLFWFVFSREAAHSDTEKVVLQSLDEQNSSLQNVREALGLLANQMAQPQKAGGDADAQMQRQLLQVAAMGLNKASLLSTLAQAKLANRQDVLDRIQAEMSGSKPDDDKQKGHDGADKQSNTKQNVGNPDAGKQGGDTHNTSKPAADDSKSAKQDAEKQSAGKHTEKQNKTPGEVKKP